MRPAYLNKSMAGRAPRSPDVEVYMTEEETLFAEWEHGNSKQRNSSEGALFSSVPSVRALSHIGAGPTSR